VRTNSPSRTCSKRCWRRFGIGTGLVIDSQPTLLAQTTQLLHPIETVAICVEVKTRFYADAIEDVVKKHQSLLDLEPLDGHSRPVFTLLTYDLGVAPETLLERRDGRRTAS
jgi:hypothetical protein